VQIKFKFEKETKGAVRFQEVEQDGESPAFAPKIGTLYIRKSALVTGQIPKHVDAVFTLT